MRKEYPKGTLERRLAAQTEIDPLSGCHIWQGRRNRTGYPLVSVHGQQHFVHRLAWTLRYGTIPRGLQLCHRCDEPRCINPDHHFVGTHEDNMADRRLKNRARRERVLADFRGIGWPGDAFRPGELARMRLYLRGVEITGKVRIRPFDPEAGHAAERRQAPGLPARRRRPPGHRAAPRPSGKANSGVSAGRSPRRAR